MRRLATEVLKDCFRPGQKACLGRNDTGGNHRVHILRQRGVDADRLPREIMVRENEQLMQRDLYWIDGLWPGKLAIGPRPRGGDWVTDDVAAWERAGLNTAVSLLTPEEEKDLDLPNEAHAVRERGMRFASFPISDREVPASQTELAALLDKIDHDLTAGKNVIVHCRAGIGRSSLVAACLLTMKGVPPQAAVKKVSAARGLSVPETKEQRNWIDQYAAMLAATK